MAVLEYKYRPKRGWVHRTSLMSSASSSKDSTPSPQTHSTCSPLWRVLDALFLFGMGNTYIQRFRQYAAESEKGNKEGAEWRHRQQREWNRLSTTLALLATLMAAILALTPEPPPLAAALWLSGSVVAVVGLFVTNYLSVKALDISNDEMQVLVQKQKFSGAHLVPIAITCPPVATYWSSLLFTVGIFDYTIRYPFPTRAHLAVALVPMIVGVMSVIATIALGEILTRDIGRARQAQNSKTEVPGPTQV
ncbi:unnamed protein product [Rhizoctonia solani]|uniref:Uncharacterized protein n=1 Tax=Rhizoctonia solani TaxID=456999 RepID=A0A8H3GTP5_9AGAM|nr:unnamed protein product [Rhizoctonia solani]